MVVIKNERELRSFAIVKAQKENGCVTKHNLSSRFTSATADSAAKKAFSRLCNMKRIKGKCTLFITVEDTTNGVSTKGKQYTYKVDRKKLDKPITLREGTNNEYKVRYEVHAASTDAPKEPKKGCEKSKGPMKKTTPRKNKQEEKKRRSRQMKKSKKHSKKRSKNNNSNRSNNAQGLIERLRIV